MSRSCPITDQPAGRIAVGRCAGRAKDGEAPSQRSRAGRASAPGRRRSALGLRRAAVHDPQRSAGATVIVNGEEIGPTPASKSFVYYGDREITLMLDGYADQDRHPADQCSVVGQLLHRVLHREHRSGLVARRARVQVPTGAGRIAAARRAARPRRELCAARPGPCPSRAAGASWDGSASERSGADADLSHRSDRAVPSPTSHDRCSDEKRKSDGFNRSFEPI